MRKFVLATLFAMLALAAPSLAADRLDQGLKPGVAIPQPFAATDQDGATRDFASLAGPNGLVLLFNRSFDW